jgi:hypothetical protein
MEWHAHLKGEDVQDSASSEHPKWGLGRGGRKVCSLTNTNLKKKTGFSELIV